MTDAPSIHTRKEYLSGDVSHNDYYDQFVTDQTRAAVVSAFGLSTLDRALAEDPHFNNIQIARWDAVSWSSLDENDTPIRNVISGRFTSVLPFNREAAEQAGETITRAVLVCIAKNAARNAVEQHRTEQATQAEQAAQAVTA